MLIYLAIVLLGMVVFHVYIRYGRYGRLINKIPGPPALPILGNLMVVTLNLEDIWTFFRVNMKLHYPIAKGWLLTSAFIITRDPDDIKILLSDKVNINKGALYKFLEIFVGSGILTATDQKWLFRRKIITPAFHQHIFRKYMEITSEQTEKFIDLLKDQGEESVQNLIPMITKLNLAVLCESMMGVNFNNLAEQEKEYRESIEEFFTTILDRMRMMYIPDWMLKFMKLGRKLKLITHRLHSFVDKIIIERREYHERTKYESFEDFIDDNDGTENMAGSNRRRLAMLDHLLFAEKKGLIDDAGIKEEMHTFTAAGHDTSAITMVYILMLLAENKKVQDLARAESFRVLDKSEGKLTMVEIQQLDYIERCIKEGLRLLPTAPNIMRSVTKDILLKNYLIPAGCDILISIFDVHRDPKFWSEPDKFDPDRFLPEEVQKRHPFAYLPFSAGARNCIGQKFAIFELKVFVARFLYNFYLEPIDFTKDLKFSLNILLQPTTKPHVRFIRINKN